MRSVLITGAALLLGAAGMAGAAEGYPTRPVRIIIPFTAGSQTDVLARMIGAKLAESSGHQVVSDNRPGAGGIVAGQIVAGANPDGQTIMLTSIAYAVSAALYNKMPYEPLKDIIGVGQVASTPLILVANPGIGVKSVKDLIAYAKARPGQVNFGSAGIGSGTHMGGELFKFSAGLDVVHVPYRGTPEALVDTAAGRVQYWFSPTGPAVAFIKDGRVQALAVTTAKRSPAFPDVPTVAEAGLPGFDYDTWYGVFAPGHTPRAVLAQINKAISGVVELPELKKNMLVQGVVLLSNPPEAFQKMVAEDVGKLRKVVKAANIKVD
jgi:tripartite-type tricarboxylate transporter receptor subunit TctC